MSNGKAALMSALNVYAKKERKEKTCYSGRLKAWYRHIGHLQSGESKWLSIRCEGPGVRVQQRRYVASKDGSE
jgi:hypothetical protein